MDYMKCGSVEIVAWFVSDWRVNIRIRWDVTSIEGVAWFVSDWMVNVWITWDVTSVEGVAWFVLDWRVNVWITWDVTSIEVAAWFVSDWRVNVWITWDVTSIEGVAWFVSDGGERTSGEWAAEGPEEEEESAKRLAERDQIQTFSGKMTRNWKWVFLWTHHGGPDEDFHRFSAQQL